MEWVVGGFNIVPLVTIVNEGHFRTRPSASWTQVDLTSINFAGEIRDDLCVSLSMSVTV